MSTHLPHLIPEIWKDIKGYEGSYQISDHGNVKSLSRQVLVKSENKEPHYRKLKERILKPRKGLNGRYDTVDLFNGGLDTKIKYYVHRLVCQAFVEKIDGKDWVNHVDGDTTNNHYTNLQWCTPKENTEHAVKSGLMNQFGEKNPNSKLKNEEVLQIRKLRNRGLTYKEIGDRFGVHKATIHLIITGVNHAKT